MTRIENYDTIFLVYLDKQTDRFDRLSLLLRALSSPCDDCVVLDVATRWRDTPLVVVTPLVVTPLAVVPLQCRL